MNSELQKTFSDNVCSATIANLRCILPTGHAGWHKNKVGTEWKETLAHDPSVPIKYFNMKDDVNHPSHYQSPVKCECGRGIECIDILEHFKDTRLGNAFKYLWRVGLGGGKGEDYKDIAKSRWYIDRWLSKNKS